MYQQGFPNLRRENINQNEANSSAFFARVEGRVQGVGFRYACMNKGQSLGLSGWVRNTAGGDVEVWAEGSREKLDILLEWLRRGPPGARVDAVHHEAAAAANYRGFRIAY